jgi:hypothetical protein
VPENVSNLFGKPFRSPESVRNVFVDHSRSAEKLTLYCFPISATLLESFVDYSKAFSKHIGHQFTEQTIRITALTGVAATEIGGDTTHREFSLNSQNDFATLTDIQNFQDTRVCIIDEVSFMDYDHALTQTSLRLQQFTQRNDITFGNMAIAFLGDFCQLEPIGGNSIYKHENGIFWEQALTCMVELKGLHRYKHCDTLTRIMPKLRATGTLTDADYKLINSRLIDCRSARLPNLETAKFASFYNRTRCRVNADVFKAYLAKYHSDAMETRIPRSGIIIKSNAVWSRSKKKLSWDQRKRLFEECCDADCKLGNRNGGNRRGDPFLCLFFGSYVMCTVNDDVKNGISNGTTATFRNIRLKAGRNAVPTKVHGYWVYSVDIDDVECLELEWFECRFRGRFRVFAKTEQYTVQYPVIQDGLNMRVATSIHLTCFPIIVNHCTTGHKLQGKSVDNLIIVEWSKVRNWAYVVLARVRKLDGLVLLKALPKDIDFSPHPQYVSMMDRLRGRILASPEDTSDLVADMRLTSQN